MSCPLTGSGPYPTTLSQKARPEGATINSHGGVPSAAEMGCGFQKTSMRPKHKPNPMASLLFNKVSFSFSCSLWEEQFWLGNLIVDTSDLSRLVMSSLAVGVLSFVEEQFPTENANEVISTNQNLNCQKQDRPLPYQSSGTPHFKRNIHPIWAGPG